MSNRNEAAFYWVVTILVVLGLLFISLAIAKAQDCPVGTKSCKVITLTPGEEQTLIDPIFATAVWGNRTLTDLIEQWKIKLNTAPAGNVPPPKDQSQVEKNK